MPGQADVTVKADAVMCHDDAEQPFWIGFSIQPVKAQPCWMVGAKSTGHDF